MSPTRSTVVRRSLVVLTAALSLVLAACGSTSGGSDAGSDTTAPAPTSAETTSKSATTSSTAPDQSTTSAPAGQGAKAYGDALAKGLDSADPANGDLALDPKQSACVAPKWVSIIGVDTFVGKDVKPKELEDPDFAVRDLGLDLDQGRAMIDAFGDCDVAIYDEFLKSLAGDLSPTQVSCLKGELDEDLAKQFLAQSLTQSSLSADLNAKLDDIDKTCKLSEGRPSADTVPTPTTR